MAQSKALAVIPNRQKLRNCLYQLNPQAEVVAEHLLEHGTITRVEAEAVYRIRHLPTRIFDIRAQGICIDSTTKHDATGQRYVRYSLAA
jgi:hypothetical protein